jgi:hypothetical protein
MSMKDNSKNNPNLNDSKNTEKIFRELVSKQIKNIASNKRLQINDIKRIAKKINTSVFDENKCATWNGYITNINNQSKGTYVNFYFRQKKVALHRLLYLNFVGDLSEDEYLKFNCENKGKCCNIHHMNKFKYNTNESNTITTETHKDQKKSLKNRSDAALEPLNSEEFYLNFD